MKKIIIILSYLFSIVAFNVNALSNNADMVVATVNNQAITFQELKNRITLSKLLINKKLSSAEFNSLKKQAIDQLITEELIRTYSKENKISIPPEDLKKAISFIEKSRSLEEGSLFKELPEHLKTSALNQIKNSILENKIIQKVIAKRVFIPEYQINTLLDNVLKQAHAKEYSISQIIINNSNNPQVDTRKILKVYEQLSSGEEFKNMAIAYSDGATKLNGGTLGWFSLDELNFKLKNSVKNLKKGEFSKPVKDINGWFIVKVDDIKVIENIDTSKTDEFKYIQFSSNNINNGNIDEIKYLAKKVNGYTDFNNFKNEVAKKYSLNIAKESEWTTLNNIPKNIKQLVEDTLPGNFSRINNNNNSLEFIYMIDTQIKQSEQVLEIRNRIKRNLQIQESELKFKQLMKDLKKDAFIELR